jgi:hypothetical protein
MKMQRRTIFALLTAGLVAKTLATPQRPDSTILMIAYLNWIARKSNNAVTLIVETETLKIDQKFTGLQSWSGLQRVSPEVDRSTAVDFLFESQQRRSAVLPLADLSPNLRVIQPLPSEVRSFFQTDEDLEAQWKKLREKYEDASSILRFSGIGFSSNFDQAVFVVSMSCGSLCGAGTLVLMQRKEEGWQVVKESGLWVS